MTFSQLIVRSTWSADEFSPAAIGARVLKTLHELAPVAPAMRNWVFVDAAGENWTALSEVERDPSAFVLGRVVHDDWGKPWPDGGYSILIKGSETPSEFGAPESIKLWIVAGAQQNNRAEFEIGRPDRPKDPRLASYPVYRGATAALAEVWPCPWALASAFDPITRRAGGQPSPRARTPFDLAWIGYLSAPLAAGLDPPRELLSEPTPGGGLFLSAVDTLIDQTDADHVRRARLLEEIMLERVGLASVGAGPRQHPARVGRY
jgi:hypothetical protein